MIDLLSITINISHTLFGSIRKIQREDHSGNTKCLTTSILINEVPILVTSLNNGSKINIRGCPLKAFQGHNIFGSNNVTMLGSKLIAEVLEGLDINATVAQLREWRKGEFQIDEIHLTHRFPVTSYAMIKSVLVHIHRYSSMALRPSIIDVGVGVRLRAPHRLAEWLFYDKCREFGDKRKREQKCLEGVVGDNAEEAGCLLHELASKSIRAELKLSKRYLKKHQLDRGRNWTVDKVKELYSHELGLLRLGAIPSLPQMPELYAQIDDSKLRSIVILWASGEDLSCHYGKTTLEKFRRAVRKRLSIDILHDQPVLESASINLSDVFDSDNMLAGFPESAKKYPELAFR